jgi:hypothetical protein
VNWREWLKSEHWKRSAVLGWLGFIVLLGRYVVTGDDPGQNIVGLVVATLGISGLWQVGKRVTQFKPEEEARAEQIRNGMGNGE